MNTQTQTEQPEGHQEYYAWTSEGKPQLCCISTSQYNLEVDRARVLGHIEGTDNPPPLVSKTSTQRFATLDEAYRWLSEHYNQQATMLAAAHAEADEYAGTFADKAKEIVESDQISVYRLSTSHEPFRTFTVKTWHEFTDLAQIGEWMMKLPEGASVRAVRGGLFVARKHDAFEWGPQRPLYQALARLLDIPA